MMRNGVVYELPMQEHPTTDLESSSSPTLPTPSVGHIRNHDEPIENYLERRQDFIQGRTKGMPGASLGVAVRMEMLPTVTVQDGKNTAGKSQFERNTLPLNAEVTLLPTVQVDDAKNTGHNQERRTTLASEVWLAETTTNWGKFAPAIERWESLTRPAPAPTKPDGKDGNHRLSAEFTEWMMGLPEGWVTAKDIGLKRNDQLKACGNGVVPQQAELALRMLLQGLQIESGGGKIAMLPTPTVSDTYTDNLKSSQQKEGSMHSVTLPQAVRQIL
jgi:DNA (cytosine-5)-methyltransferase 1